MWNFKQEWSGVHPAETKLSVFNQGKEKMKSRFMMLAVTLVAVVLGMAGPVGAVPAANDNTVLILGPTVTGDAASLEAVTAFNQGFDVEVVSAAIWDVITAAQFATYRAIILGDPSDTANIGLLAAAEANRLTWGPEIDGNVIIIGTNPRAHSSFGGVNQGGDEVTDFGIAFAAALADKTGAYISLSAYYFTSSASTTVDVLDQFGTFTVIGQQSITGGLNDIHIVASVATGAVTDANLSNWGNSVHEAFDSFDPSFEPYAILETFAGGAGAGELNFPDGSSGIPYILTFGAFVAVVEPDGNNSVDVFTSAGNPNNDNPFDFTYQRVVTAGTVTASCCTFPAFRETEGTGRGRSNFYNVRALDVGSALAASPDPNCVDLVALVGTGEVVLRPWQRVLPNPVTFPTDAEREPLYTGTLPADVAARAALEWGVCAIESTVESDGVALTTENAEKLVVYSVDCNENDLDFRPLTGGTSIDPQERSFASVRSWSAECDDSRSGRRSSLLVYLLNMRNDTDLHSPRKIVSRVLGDLAKEIEFEVSTPTCVPIISANDFLNPLLAKLDEAKKAINDAKNDPSGILSTAIPLLDELTLLALDLPFCSTNFKGLATGRAMNATFMACSYLGHPDSFLEVERDVNGVFISGDCPINQDVLDEILGL